MGSSRSGTTITRNIISRHPKIHITNELRIYSPKLFSKDPGVYFHSIQRELNRYSNDYHKLPRKLNKKHFASACMKKLKKDTIENRLIVVEGLLFNNTFEFLGDKGGEIGVINRLHRLGIKCELIYIHRDGRDVASSGVRSRRNIKPPWSSDAVANAKHWAHRVNTFIKNPVDAKKHIVIRFEDYMLSPGKNMKAIEDFLGVKGLVKFEKSMIAPKKAHISGYKKHCPNWEKDFPKWVKDVLKELDYV